MESKGKVLLTIEQEFSFRLKKIKHGNSFLNLTDAMEVENQECLIKKKSRFLTATGLEPRTT